ncbi:MAG TPA: hypothetical protein PKD64_04930 [Pirellulaceae bacterium]|nr:hypothetical protein [Pirellulaceae bacterium]HMO91519.1 hypothetical protein [Pirellulaceae bacterium]HMP68217.1 hypothetical protein [Pirellulaceae bacterium]
MAKFYVGCGHLSLIVEAEDAGGAALWAVHRWIGDIESNTCLEFRIKKQTGSLALSILLLNNAKNGSVRLADEITVSEIGIGYDDAGRFNTELVLEEYCELASAVTSLVTS